MYFRHAKSTEAAFERTIPTRMRQTMAWPRICCHSASLARTWTLATACWVGQIFALYTQIRYFWMPGLVDSVLFQAGRLPTFQSWPRPNCGPTNSLKYKGSNETSIHSDPISCASFKLLTSHCRRKSQAKASLSQIPGLILPYRSTQTSLYGLAWHSNYYWNLLSRILILG